jgi:hypothetical protein
MVQYCEEARGGTVFPILDSPAGYSATDVVKYVTTTAALEGPRNSAPSTGRG